VIRGCIRLKTHFHPLKQRDTKNSAVDKRALNGPSLWIKRALEENAG